MTSSNHSDENFLQEANEYLDTHSSTVHGRFPDLLVISSPFYCIFQ